MTISKTKNNSIRKAFALTVAALLTMCLVGATYAKYTTTSSGSSTAKVAAWGFAAPATMDLSSMFSATYSNVASEDGTTAVIAPGTSGNVKFSFPYDESVSKAPEVAYSFTVDVSVDDDSGFLSNPDVKFALDNGSWTTWDNVKTAILTLSGDASGTKTYKAGELPAAFTAKDDQHTIYWQWSYENSTAASASQSDAADTSYGNADTLPEVTINLSVSATQID